MATPAKPNPAQATTSPDYAPYIGNMLTKGQQFANTPFVPYSGKRFAGASPLQQQGFAGIAGLQLPPQFGMATSAYQNALKQAKGMQGYDPADFDSFNFQNYQQKGPADVSAQLLKQYQMAGVDDVTARKLIQQQMGGIADVTADRMKQYQMGGIDDVTADKLKQYKMAGVDDVTAQKLIQYQMDAGKIDDVTARKLQQYQMTGPKDIGTQDFTKAGVAEKFMSPYIQNVLAAQQQDAQRQDQIAGESRRAQFANAGGYGGSRQAIMDAEAARNLSEQKADIYGQGMQSAYTAGMGQFNAQQQAQLEAAKANQSSAYNTALQNLQARLGVQQLGSEQDLKAQLANQQMGFNIGEQNLAARLGVQQLGSEQAMKAALANQAAGLTVGKENLASLLATQQLGSEQSLKARLANQQMGYNVGSKNLESLLATQQFGAEQSLKARLANQQMGYNVGKENLASRLETQRLQAEQQMKADLANQSAGLTVGKENLASRLATQQLGSEQYLKAKLANQTMGYNVGQNNLEALLGIQKMRGEQNLAGQKFEEDSRQFGAQQNRNSILDQIAAAQGLGSLGTAQGTQNLANINAKLAAGATQQEINQKPLDFGYQQWQQSVNYPQWQAENMQKLLQYLPLHSTDYVPEQSIGQSIAGGGLTGLALYNMLIQSGVSPADAKKVSGQ